MIRRWLLINLAAMAIFFGIGLYMNAHAWDINVYEGVSYTKRAPNGVWWQAGMPYQYQLAAKSKNLAVSGWYNSWLKLEANYIDFGQINGSLSFVSDENYSGSEKDPCRHPCEAPRTARWTADSKALGFSIMPTLKHKESEIGLRLGVMRHNTRTNVIAENFDDNYVKDPTPSVGYYNMSHRGFSWFYGGQFKLVDKKDGVLKLVYMHAPDVRSGYDGFQRGIKSVHLNYRLEF